MTSAKIVTPGQAMAKIPAITASTPSRINGTDVDLNMTGIPFACLSRTTVKPVVRVLFSRPDGRRFRPTSAAYRGIAAGYASGGASRVAGAFTGDVSSPSMASRQVGQVCSQVRISVPSLVVIVPTHCLHVGSGKIAAAYDASIRSTALTPLRARSRCLLRHRRLLSHRSRSGVLFPDGQVKRTCCAERVGRRWFTHAPNCGDVRRDL